MPQTHDVVPPVVEPCSAANSASEEIDDGTEAPASVSIASTTWLLDKASRAPAREEAQDRLVAAVFQLSLSAKHAPGGYDESILNKNPSAQLLVESEPEVRFGAPPLIDRKLFAGGRPAGLYHSPHPVYTKSGTHCHQEERLVPRIMCLIPYILRSPYLL